MSGIVSESFLKAGMLLLSILLDQHRMKKTSFVCYSPMTKLAMRDLAKKDGMMSPACNSDYAGKMSRLMNNAVHHGNVAGLCYTEDFGATWWAALDSGVLSEIY